MRYQVDITSPALDTDCAAFSFPHGLPGAPTSLPSIVPTSLGEIAFQDIATPYDFTYFYLQASGPLVTASALVDPPLRAAPMPSFTSFYNALFTEPLILQFIAIIQANMQAALDLVTGVPFNALSPTLGLQTFIEYDLDAIPPKNWPQLIVVPPRALKIDEGSQQTERSGGPMEFIVTIANQDPNILAIQLQQYLRALSYVIDTAASNAAMDQSQFYQTLPLALPFLTTLTTTPIQTGSLIYARVVGHQLGSLYRLQKGTFLKSASLLVRIDLEEI